MWHFQPTSHSLSCILQHCIKSNQDVIPREQESILKFKFIDSYLDKNMTTESMISILISNHEKCTKAYKGNILIYIYITTQPSSDKLHIKKKWKYLHVQRNLALV